MRVPPAARVVRVTPPARSERPSSRDGCRERTCSAGRRAGAARSTNAPRGRRPEGHGVRPSACSRPLAHSPRASRHEPMALVNRASANSRATTRLATCGKPSPQCWARTASSTFASRRTRPRNGEVEVLIRLVLDECVCARPYRHDSAHGRPLQRHLHDDHFTPPSRRAGASHSNAAVSLKTWSTTSLGRNILRAADRCRATCDIGVRADGRRTWERPHPRAPVQSDATCRD